MEKNIVQIQDYLINNEVAPALHKLRSIFSLANSPLTNDAVIVLGRFKKLQSDARKGVIDYAEETLRHSQIMDAALSLLDEIKQAPAQFAAYDRAEDRLDRSISEKGQAELPGRIKDALFDRIAYVKEKGIQVKALWIDDHPEYNEYEVEVLATFGVEVQLIKSSEDARRLLAEHEYVLVLSDLSRTGRHTEGLDFHRELILEGTDLPFIFYTAKLDRSKGVPPYAFGITDLPNELFHLVLDVIERKY